MSFILNAIKVFFLFLAECIFDIGVMIYNFIITIAQTPIFKQAILTDFASRIYVLLGIFMLFKVSFSLVNYIVNPDDFTDKEKGVGKLVPNIMITLVLIVFTPRIFAEAMDLQQLLLKEQFLENIIFADSSSDGEFSLNSNNGGEKIALEVFNSFYHFDYQKVIDEDVENKVESAAECDLDRGECRYKSYEKAFSSSSPYNAYDGIWDGTAEYHEFLAIIAAVVFVLVVLQFCFDIAIRTVKLGFLQLISPIPIMSRIDPKSAKNGMFSKWIKMSLKTYTDLFIRLAALDFAVVLIQIIIDSFNQDSNSSFMVRVFLILGTLMFAKQLPKLIEDLFGIKLDGGFTLNPVKRLEKDVPGGKMMTGAVAGFAQGAIGAVTGAGVGSLVTGTLGGAFRNKGFTDTWNKQKTSNKNMRTALLEGSTFGGRMRKRVDGFVGLGGEDYRLEREKNKIEKDKSNIQDKLDMIDSDIKIEEDKKAAIKGTAEYRDRQYKLEQQNAVFSASNKIKERAISQVMAGEGDAGKKYNKMLQEAAGLSHLTEDSFKRKDSKGKIKRKIIRTSDGTLIHNVREAAEYAEKLKQDANSYVNNNGWKEYTTQVSKGGHDDASLKGLQEKFDDAYKAANNGAVIDHNIDDYGKKLNEALGKAKGEITDLEVKGNVDDRRLAEIDRKISEYNRQKSEPNGPNEQMRKASDELHNLGKQERINKANETGIK